MLELLFLTIFCFQTQNWNRTRDYSSATFEGFERWDLLLVKCNSLPNTDVAVATVRRDTNFEIENFSRRIRRPTSTCSCVCSIINVSKEGWNLFAGVLVAFSSMQKAFHGIQRLRVGKSKVSNHIR